MEYGQGASYWNDRYTEEDTTFEWYQSYEGLAGFLSKHIKPGYSVLVIGSGNSRTSVLFSTFAPSSTATVITLSYYIFASAIECRV